MDKRILEKFFNDEATPAEIRKVLKWFDSQEINPQKIQALEELWQTMDESDFVSHDEDQIFQEIRQKIFISDDRNNSGKKRYAQPSYQVNRRVLTWGSAAAILITVGILLFGEANEWWANNNKEGIKQITKIAEAGQKKILTLADGTVIRLNAESSIRFPAEFSETKREVFLTGEAFFEVSKDSARPFIVQAGKLSATVLGTSFNIKSYPQDDLADISLATGKLRVEGSDKARQIASYVLAPGEAAMLDKKNNTLKKTQFDPTIKLGWIKGDLVFEDADIDEIITRIERWYGVIIEVENREVAASQQWKYRGIFKNESLEEVLKGISFVKGFAYEIENKSVKVIF